jgi:hypothetical protein
MKELDENSKRKYIKRNKIIDDIEENEELFDNN